MTPVSLVVSALIASALVVSAYAEEYLRLVFVALGLSGLVLFFTRKWTVGWRRRHDYDRDPD